MTRGLAVTSVLLVVWVAACDVLSEPEPTRRPCGDPRSGAPSLISGELTTEDGEPVALARIEATPRTGAGVGDCFLVEIEGGRYALPVERGFHDVYAWHAFDFDGDRYWLPMLTGERFLYASVDAREPATADFRVADPTPDGVVEIRWGARPVPEADGSVLAFRMTPTGPTVEGSTEPFVAEVLDYEVFRASTASTASGRGGGVIDVGGWVPAPPESYLRDIPLGEYRVTGEWRPATGIAQVLELATTESGAYAVEIVVRFEPETGEGYGVIDPFVFARPATR